MSRPNERQLQALRDIAEDDQGPAGELDIFVARECEGLGWVNKVGDRYRLTEAGKRQVDEAAKPAARRDGS